LFQIIVQKKSELNELETSRTLELKRIEGEIKRRKSLLALLETQFTDRSKHLEKVGMK
jgi:hypothetical protein